MEKLIFATNNKHKVDEIRLVLGTMFDIITLQEAWINIDIPEPHDTLEANALEKSGTIYKMTGKNCFSEDTGLEVMALGGEPGVKSARYAGEQKDFEANIDKLLSNLQPHKNRAAQFRTVISLILHGKEFLFEGVCSGHINVEKKGRNGFGYDAVFIPEGMEQTFAEMSMEEKSVLSHRKKAMEKMIAFLKSVPVVKNKLSS
jgi:XTP/dITP diphosphohydrolase